MIAERRTRDVHLVSAWAAGIALLCLGIGLHGATAPLIPVSDSCGERGCGPGELEGDAVDVGEGDQEGAAGEEGALG